MKLYFVTSNPHKIKAAKTILNNIVLSSVIAIVLATIITAILIVPVWVINRWFPYIIGRQNKKN